MKRRMRILLAVLEAAFVLVAVYFEPTYTVRGTLWGEAFFEGKPTSWWRRELERWETNDIWLDGRLPNGPVCLAFHQRKPTWLESFRKGRWQFSQEEPEFVLVHIGGMVGPTIIQGQPDAEPVLRELLDDPSPKVRRFARIGLEMAPEEVP
jgi:hypothetical protein